jgi:membrane-associated protease RseP (regulator of RpoE activity)
MSGGVGGAMREYIVRGSDFVLGAEQIQHPIVALAAVSIGIIRNRRNRSAQALCGDNQLPGQAPVLNRYETAPADLDTYNRSGMRIETGFDAIPRMSVAAGTPAAEAGLQPGDVIVSPSPPAEG